MPPRNSRQPRSQRQPKRKRIHPDSLEHYISRHVATYGGGVIISEKATKTIDSMLTYLQQLVGQEMARLGRRANRTTLNKDLFYASIQSILPKSLEVKTAERSARVVKNYETSKVLRATAK